MTSQSSPAQLTQEIREIVALGGSDSRSKVECHLDSALSGCDLAGRLSYLESLARELETGVAQGGPAAGAPVPAAPAAGAIHGLVARFLGQSAAAEGLSSRELEESFAAALDTLFDALNEIVSVINVTLLGQSPELETIRKVIGSNLKGDQGFSSLKEYLERIQKAFLVAHGCFQLSSATIMKELLSELDPQLLNSAKNSGLRFGPLRKAELYEQYEEKHARCRRWFDSGQYKERLLREFEKQCQIHFDTSAR
jgi:hypothetical protein